MKIRLNFLGDTIAHYACFRNNYQLVELLKKLGADFSIPNNNGMTPADLTEDPEILKLIGGK
jgi:ankyrin repeat protein